MNYISFFVGFILGIMSLSLQRFVIIFRIGLSCITAGYFMKIIHPDLYIWHVHDYDDSSNISRFLSDLGLQSFLLVFISYITFYWLFYFVIDYLILKRIDKKIKKKVEIMNLNTTQTFTGKIRNVFVNVIGFMIKYRLKKLNKINLRSKEEIEGNGVISYLELKNDISLSFLISIHILVCSLMINKLFSLNAYILVVVIVAATAIIIVLWLAIKILPIYKYLYIVFMNTVRDEYNFLIQKETTQ